MLAGQGEGHPRVAAWRAEMEHASRGDDHVLAASDLVSRRRTAAVPRELRLPQFLAVGFVESADFVIKRAGTKEQAACRHDGAAKIHRALGRHPLGCKRG